MFNVCRIQSLKSSQVVAAMWICGYVASGLCGYVVMWQYSYVAMRLCGYVAMWKMPWDIGWMHYSKRRARGVES